MPCRSPVIDTNPASSYKFHAESDMGRREPSAPDLPCPWPCPCVCEHGGPTRSEERGTAGTPARITPGSLRCVRGRRAPRRARHTTRNDDHDDPSPPRGPSPRPARRRGSCSFLLHHHPHLVSNTFQNKRNVVRTTARLSPRDRLDSPLAAQAPPPLPLRALRRRPCGEM